MTNPSTPDPYAAPASASNDGAVGATSLIIGIVLVVIGIVQTFVAQALPLLAFDQGMSFSQLAIVLSGFTVLTIVVAVAGIVTGILGLQPSRVRGRLAAAAGLALGAAHVLGAVFALTAPLVIGAFL